jgi:FKBP-type peptidyl-prolyl cis-trans isomerase FkpA
MKKIRRGALRASACAMVVALVAVGCSSESSTTPLPFEVIEEVTFHESLDIDLTAMTRTESGLYYQDIALGGGEVAESESEVSVHYRLRLRSGAEVESSFEGAPITFTIDVSSIIEGFNEGVRGMRVGGERKLVVPPQLAYGIRGPEGILIFDVELMEVVGAEP